MRRAGLVVVSSVLLVLATILPSLLVSAPAQHQHGLNDHYQTMYAGGVPEWGDAIGPVYAAELCAELADEAQECLTAAGLGANNDNRSYLNELPANQTIYATTDGIPDGPYKGWPACIPDHKDTTEIGPFLFLATNVTQYHNYGPPVAQGPAGPPATMGCVRWHAQTAGNFIGRFVNQVGIDGTGRRARVAEIHQFTYMAPNPCYGKPCAGEYKGRYLVGNFRAFVMEIAPSASQTVHLNPARFIVPIIPGSEAGQEVWYLANFTPDGDKGHIEGHYIGQNRIPLSSVKFARSDGTSERAVVAAADGVFTWNTCGTNYSKRRDPGIPCVKSSLPAGATVGAYKGRTVQNPNEGIIPQDWLGNRLLPLSYHWVKCLEDQQQLAMPVVKDGDGNWLNPHEITPLLPARIIPYQRPECAYTVDIGLATEFPPAGLRGVPNGVPAPEPTGEPALTETPEPTPTATSEPTSTSTPEPTPTATPEPTLTPTPEAPTPEPTLTPVIEPTATQAPSDWRHVFVADVSHYWASDVYNVEAKPTPDVIDVGPLALDLDHGDGPPREGLPSDNWTAVHYGTWTGPIQAIRVRCDDECRVVINDGVEWDGVAYGTREIPISHLEQGTVPVRVERRDQTGKAYTRIEFIQAPVP